MRKQLCDALCERASNEKMVFLTGDLGFMALEPLKGLMGERFINAGVAEQNMITVSAAIASEGMETWVYSIAPFCYARPFEQIRNDICFHNLPVKIIGNGGGYGYGVMGPTHHAIEDYGILLTLPGMSAFIPAFDEDLDQVIKKAGESKGPSYIRLGRGELPKDHASPEYAPWRKLSQGGGDVVIVVGPLAGTYLSSIESLSESVRPELWVVSELPLSKNPLPKEISQRIENGRGLIVIEEHVARGGFGSELALFLLEKNITPSKFKHMRAKQHMFDAYGSQKYLREQSNLHPEFLLSLIEESDV